MNSQSYFKKLSQQIKSKKICNFNTCRATVTKGLKAAVSPQVTLSLFFIYTKSSVWPWKLSNAVCRPHSTFPDNFLFFSSSFFHLTFHTSVIIFCRDFWLNIAKFKVNWCYRYCFKLFSNLRKERKLRQYYCQNSTKVGERKIKRRREKFLIFGNSIAAILSAHSATRWKKKLAIVAMPLPKMKKKKKKRCYEIYERVKKSCHVHNIFTTFSQ